MMLSVSGSSWAMETLKKQFEPSSFLDEVFKDGRLHCDVLRQALDLHLTVDLNGIRYEKDRLAVPVPKSPCEEDEDDFDADGGWDKDD